MDTIADRARNPDTNEPESKFRYQVRDILGLTWDTRDDKIFSELKRLKDVDRRVNGLR